MAKCVPCISNGLKKLILEYDARTKKLLDSIPNCPPGVNINFCLTGKGMKRAPSEYQQFVSQCMKTKPIQGKPFGAASQYMGECAAEWRKRSGKS
jgi:hypothetical protein